VITANIEGFTPAVIASVSIMLFSLILLALPVRNAFGRIIRILIFIGVVSASAFLLLSFFKATPPTVIPIRARPTGSIPIEHLNALLLQLPPVVGNYTLVDITTIISNIVSIISGVIGIIKDIAGLARRPQQPPPYSPPWGGYPPRY
jgi:hypothetical protein